MSYARLTGRGAAFGWISDGRITAGGLRPETEYLLVCERDRFPIRTDARGAWTGQVLHDVPLCVAAGSRAALWDESRISEAAAAALLTPREEPAVRETRQETQQEAAEPEPIPIETEEEAQEEEPPTQYRAPSANAPVDALPELVWPAAAAQLKPYFDRLPPVRLFEDPGWRQVKAQESGMTCCFGYRAADDRVCEVLYGVRARGGLTPPKGLQGYRYERAADGGGYWVLRQRV